jgi:hypothetical protein
MTAVVAEKGDHVDTMPGTATSMTATAIEENRIRRRTVRPEGMTEKERERGAASTHNPTDKATVSSRRAMVPKLRNFACL